MNEETKSTLEFTTITTDETVGDTHVGMTWQEFIEIAKVYGFECGLCQKFKGHKEQSTKKSVEEEEIIFFHKEKGLILYAESYYEKFLNNAKVYGEVKIGEALKPEQWKALNHCSHGENDNGTMHISLDARQDLRLKLDSISEAFEFSKSWTTVPFMWFLNYMDNKKRNYNYDKINNQKIKASTPEVHKIIFG